MSAEHPRYGCSKCDYEGDEYALRDDGTSGGMAVCPECRGELRLWVSQ